MFLGVMALIGAIALWAYLAGASLGAVVVIVICGLVLTLLIFVVTPLMLGARYGITPATRTPKPRSR